MLGVRERGQFRRTMRGTCGEGRDLPLSTPTLVLRLTSREIKAVSLPGLGSDPGHHFYLQVTCITPRCREVRSVASSHLHVVWHVSVGKMRSIVYIVHAMYPIMSLQFSRCCSELPLKDVYTLYHHEDLSHLALIALRPRCDNHNGIALRKR